MLDAIEIECRILPGAPGWATLTVKAGGRSIEVPSFSHALTDSFDDLVRATLYLTCGGWRTKTFSMDDEPEPLWQWQLKREPRGYGPDRRQVLDVTTTRIDDLETMAATDIFIATCDPDQFARAVLEAMRGMMSAEPREELLRRWSHFPVRAIAALDAALAIPPDAVIL